MIRFRQFLHVAILLAVLLILAVPASGATHPDIGIAAPETLLSGIEFLDEGGSYRQITTMNGDQLTAVLTVDFAPPRTTSEPGPVVVYWQLMVSVTDIDFGDVYTKILGPPQSTTVLPTCEDSGACAIHFSVAGPIQPAVDASELDWVHSTWLKVAFTAVRTFGEGELVQPVEPGYAEATGGTINDPVDVDGGLMAAAVVPIAEAGPAVLPSEEFQGGKESTFDWADATASALADLPTPGPPAPPGRLNPTALTAIGVIAVFAAGIAVGYLLRRRFS